MPRDASWKRLIAAADDLVRSGEARAVFLLGAGDEVIHARGDFATQVLYPPPSSALRRGWASVRSGSGDLLVFIALPQGGLLGGAFAVTANADEARRILERAIAAANAP